MSEVKIAVVTGANAGLGYHTTLKLARKGYTVVMGCRSLERAEAAREQLLAEVPGAVLDIIPLDLSDPASITAFVETFGQRYTHLDLLVNNAGIVGVPLTFNSADHELHFATNYLGPFALTGLLLPFFDAAKPGRIVNVGSLAHRLGKLPLDDLNWKGEKPEYDPMKAYARSKIATQSFNQELARRLAASGSKVISVGAHPGFAATEITRKTGYGTPTSGFKKWFQGKMERLVPTPDQASEPTMLAACGDAVANGDYYGPGGFLEIGGKPAPAKVNKLAKDLETGKRLWALTEDMTGVRFLSDL
ncbi:SDR family NAD(P)-dependent oxidoreductase [Haliea sp. E17]|uniref:SDR family NAD(P)-dependent oxidoreductase n=1 Tax=Haliea sp. E17 TaxID=3401576 RepID=UPI003AAD59D8